jgi:3-polyprenyl-4-hydroxybenzoate decarboxylase
MLTAMRAPFRDLRSFLDQLRRDRDLAVISAQVDPRLEAAEIHRRVIAAGGPALLLTRLRGRSGSVATNLFGTPRRAQLAFGTRPEAFIRKLVGLAHELLPPTPRKLWGARDLAWDALHVGLARKRSGPVRNRISATAALDSLPALTTWPEDGGPFLTLPLVYTEHPETKGHNLGMYRMQIHGPRTAGMHWQIGKGGGYHYAVAESRNENLPVTVFLGGPPALIAGERLALCPGPGPHPLIAQAEFALVGKVAPRRRQPEGPFGDHYGYYSLVHDYPVFELDSLAQRPDAILPATVVGKPRQEDFYIGDLLQELLSPLFPLVMPAVEALWSYGETGYHSLAAAVVKQRYGREAMASAFRILGEGQLSLTKFLLLTDQSVDLHDFRATLSHVLARTRTETDLYVFANLAMDTLDYTGPRINEGSKGVWLGLGDPVRALPGTFEAAEVPAGMTGAKVFCPGCLVIGGPAFTDEPGAAARFAPHPAFATWPLVVLTDEPERAAASAMNFLWTTFTRFEPAADLYAAATEVVRHHLSYRAPILIDARRKPGFPAELFCDPETAATVTRRWGEYFPEGDVEMGDSGLAHLQAV